MDREIEIDLTDASGENFEFKSLRALHEFVSEERDFWKKQHANVGKQSIHRLLNSFNHFEGIADKIDSWSQYIDKWSDDEFSGNIRKLQQENIRHINTDNWLWSKHPAAYPYVSCHKERGHEAATTFINLVLKNNLPNNLNNADVFFGALAGYEFLVQDSPIVKRKNGEKLSLGRLRNQLAEAKDKLFYEVESFKNEYTEWSNNSRGNFNKLYRVTKKLGDRQRKRENNQFVSQLHNWSSTIEDLERTYEEKLRLQKPAEYWNKSARKYGIQGGLWSLALVVAIVLGLVYFREFFVTWLQGKEIGVQLTTVQGVILFGTFVAVYAYLLRVLSKLVFSAFHLMRDAEEREQLTYLYLSLSKEAEVDKESRDIILQALFSRTETGLLSSDSGPTMPVVSELTKAVK